MEQYTDDERVEDLKKWWKENGVSIIGGIALGVIAIFGWRYWGSYRDTQAEQTSRAYDAFVAAVEKPDADQARQRGQALATDFPKSPYAALAALRLAKLAMDGGDTAAASQRLEWVVGNARLDELKDIARLRLAQVKLAAGQTAEAEKLLDGVTTTSLNAEREDLKGDLYLASKNPEKARIAYAAALAASSDKRLLQLKLDNLATATPETVVPAPPTPPSPPEPAKASTAAPAEAATTPAEPAAGAVPAVTPAEPAAGTDERPFAPTATINGTLPAPTPPVSTSSGQ
ncbi:MAG: tetratricopeptide repeat protein [Candidatus Contendobacter sp.]